MDSNARLDAEMNSESLPDKCCRHRFYGRRTMCGWFQAAAPTLRRSIGIHRALPRHTKSQHNLIDTISDHKAEKAHRRVGTISSKAAAHYLTSSRFTFDRFGTCDAPQSQTRVVGSSGRTRSRRLSLVLPNSRPAAAISRAPYPNAPTHALCNRGVVRTVTCCCYTRAWISLKRRNAA